MFEEKLLALIEELGRPVSDQDIIKEMEIESSQLHMVRDALAKMVEDGKLFMTKKGKFGLPKNFGLHRGRIQIAQKGFGFLLPDDKEMEDVFIPASELMGAMNGDEVFVKITKRKDNGKKLEGKVERVLSRKNETIVGNFDDNGNYGFVVPDDQRIKQDVFIPKREFAGAKSGQKVVVKITKWPEERRSPEGKIVEILGDKDDVGVDIRSIIKMHQLREVFPKKVISRAEEIPTEISPEVLKDRKDLRKEVIVTIDGADAKDLDDAVRVEKQADGTYLLGVYIADVAHYVHERSPIDKEALERATSVYLIDRVLPMLPEALSNGVCSLNPHVDRLVLGLEMKIDSQGKVLDQEVFEGVINSNHRLVYDDVSDFLEEGILTEDLKPIEGLLQNMKELALILREAREQRGAIDFDFAESYIELDETGKPIDIRKRERRIANRIIEEFMLKANETISEHFYWLEVPFLYRIHEQPTPEKIEEFNKFIYNFGYRLKGSGEEIHPKAVQQLIADVKGKKEEHIINKLMLRSLKQARYSPDAEGHFGLAATYYSHFTSPIRRYPDLQIHRIIKEFLHGKLDDNRINHYDTILDGVAKQSSEMERVAESAERDVDDLKMAEYMLDKIGNIYDGMVSGVTSFGIFIELENTVEGLVRLVDLTDDYYEYDSESLRMIGQHKGNIISIGDEVTVKVSKVDLDKKAIDFELMEVKGREAAAE